MEFTTRMIDSASCKSGRNRHFFILFYPDSFVKRIFFLYLFEGENNVRSNGEEISYNENYVTDEKVRIWRY